MFNNFFQINLKKTSSFKVLADILLLFGRSTTPHPLNNRSTTADGAGMAR
jgi:hypothetical protein